MRGLVQHGTVPRLSLHLDALEIWPASATNASMSATRCFVCKRPTLSAIRAFRRPPRAIRFEALSWAWQSHVQTTGVLTR